MLGLGAGITNSTTTDFFTPEDVSIASSLELWISSTEGLNTTSTEDVSSWDNLSDDKQFLKLASNSAPIHEPALSCVKFDGTTNGDALVLNNASSNPVQLTLDQDDGGYTICFIATTEAFDSESTLLGSTSNADSGVVWADGVIRLTVAGSNYDFEALNLNDETFYSFMFVVKDSGSNNAKLYVNNSEADAKTINEDFVFGMIGGNNGQPKNVVFSRLRQLIIYNSEISDADRDKLYTEYIRLQLN